MNFIVNPYMYLFLSATLSFMSSIFYSLGSIKIVYLSIPIFIFFLVTYSLGSSIKQKLFYQFNNTNIILNSIYWKVIAFLIITISILEYLKFGFPLFGGVVYNKFGFPILHHLVVTSWLLLFIKFNSKVVNFLLLIFVFLNPILICNRDLLLLTLLTLFIKKTLEGKISIKLVIISILLIIIIFGLIGQLRSGNAIDFINLPLTFNKDNINPIFFWFMIYVTSSTFNMGYNIDNATLTLYEPLINVFPEQYRWYLISAEMTYFLYYILLFIIMTFTALVAKNKNYLPLYIYFIYQSLMGVTFATKVFTTNTLMIVLIFVIFFILPKRNFYATN